MDYNKLNNFLGNLKIDENAEFEKRKQQIMNRDFNFMNESNNSVNRNLNVNENFNIQTRIQNVNQNQIIDLKGDINDRLKSREYIPNTGTLNIHGKNLPIIDRFPKSSRDMPNPQ